MMSWQPYWSPINNEVVENNFLQLLATKVKMLRKDYYITGSTGLVFRGLFLLLFFTGRWQELEEWWRDE